MTDERDVVAEVRRHLESVDPAACMHGGWLRALLTLCEQADEGWQTAENELAMEQCLRQKAEQERDRLKAEVERLVAQAALDRDLFTSQNQLFKIVEQHERELVERVNRYEQDIEAAFRQGWASWATGEGALSKALARFKASRKGGSDGHG